MKQSLKKRLDPLRWLPALAAAAVCPVLHAAIAPGGNATGTQLSYRGNGELFFMVGSEISQSGYTLDLGITVSDFFIAGQPDAGVQRFWVVDDASWSTFAAEAKVSDMKWAVMGFDAFGSLTTPGGYKWYTTAKQGTEGKVGELNNSVFVGRVGSIIPAYPDSVNPLGTHGGGGSSANYSINGHSYSSELLKSRWYGGSTVGSKLASVPFETGNAVGQSSWFYYMTPSNGVGTDFALVDEFDNLGHDGYWGFTYVEPTVDSPYAGKYLLSYTMQAALATATQREFANSIGRTEWNGGFGVTRLGLAGTAGLESPSAAAFTQRLGLAMMATPVPEPGTLGLAALGLLALLGHRARQRARAR